MRQSTFTLGSRVRALGESIDFCDCKLGRTIISAERQALIHEMNRAQAQELTRRNKGYMGRG